MAFTTYAELQAAVLSRIDRSDLTTEVVDWITIAEKDISRWPRISWLEKRAYATPTEAFIQVPTDFGSLRDLQWNYSNYRVPLEQVSPDLIDKVYSSNSTGLPCYFCINDGHFELRPAPAVGNETTLEITYYKKPTALSDSNTSNEILVNVPDALFYRTLVEGYDHILNPELAGKYAGMYNQIRQQAEKESKRKTWDGVPLRVMTDSVV
jgi:hypothetical protein